MKRTIYATLFLAFSFITTQAQNFPYPALVGYWESWNNTMYLKDVDPNYNVVEVAFATTKGSSMCKMEFNYPWFYSSKTAFKADIQTLHNQGRTVLLSIGGANDPVLLSNYLEKDTFITTMNAVLDDYAFDGIDIDFENASLAFSNVTLANPTDSNLINLIDAIKQVLQHYQTSHSKRCFLTMAPEIIHVQGGIESNSNGKFLPVIDALRNDLDLLMVQLYNMGNSVGVDGWSGQILHPSTSDFIIGLTEAVILGFNVKLSGGVSEHFDGLPARKVAVGLLSCDNAGQHYTDTTKVMAAVKYLLGIGLKPETYALKNPSGTASLGGMMTWSINKDKACTTAASNSFSRNFAKMFGGVGIEENTVSALEIYPNPSTTHFTINVHEPVLVELYNIVGAKVFEQKITQQHTFDLSDYAQGLYIIKVGNQTARLIKE
jgi:chitinase